MGFPILVRWHLYIESGPWSLLDSLWLILLRACDVESVSMSWDHHDINAHVVIGSLLCCDYSLWVYFEEVCRSLQVCKWLYWTILKKTSIKHYRYDFSFIMACGLAVITDPTVVVPCNVFKLLQLIWRLGTCRSCREWRCSWSSGDGRCSNYNWVIDNCIAY